MCKRGRCHFLCLQETHGPTSLSMPKIAGMSLVAEHPHNKYGSAVLIREGYGTTYNNGEAVEQWEDSCDLTLIHDAKLPKSFNSARWKKGL